MSKGCDPASVEAGLRKKDEELFALEKKSESAKASAVSVKEPSNPQVVAVFNELLESLIVDIAAEAHRAARLGLDFRLQAEETEEASIRLSEASKVPGVSEAIGSKYTVDVFGLTHPPVAMENCACKNCGRVVVAGRYAPHLEKCMNNKGRNASRVASRNIQNSARQQRRASPQRATPMVQAQPGADLSSVPGGDFWGKVPAGNKRSRSRTPNRTPIISPEGSLRSGAEGEDGTSEESHDQEEKDATYGPGSAKSKKGRSGNTQKQKQRSVGLSGLGNVNRGRSNGNGLPGGGLPPVAPTGPTWTSGGHGGSAHGKGRHATAPISPPTRIQPHAATSPVGSSLVTELATMTGKRTKGGTTWAASPLPGAEEGGASASGAQGSWPSSGGRTSKSGMKSEGQGAVAGDDSVVAATHLKQKPGPGLGGGMNVGIIKGEEIKKPVPKVKGQARPGPVAGVFTSGGDPGEGDVLVSGFEFENGQTKRKSPGVRVGKGKVGKQSTI